MEFISSKDNFISQLLAPFSIKLIVSIFCYMFVHCHLRSCHLKSDTDDPFVIGLI